MKVDVPAYLVAAAGPVVVALCTACKRRTLRPNRAMMDRYGSVITDGCGDCPSPIDHDDVDPVFISRGGLDPGGKEGGIIDVAGYVGGR